jgi:hypothetical protein
VSAGPRLNASEVLPEIQARLRLAEERVEGLRRRYRSASEGDARIAVLRQLEVACAVAVELADLEGLVSGRPEV